MMLAGRGELVDRQDRVGTHSNTEQSVFLRSDVDQVEHISANIVHPGVNMSRSQPVTDGPAGPVRTCRPVGTEWRGANMTIPDHVTMEQRSGMSAARCHIPPDGVTIDRPLPKGINSNRNEKPIWTPSLKAEVRTTACVEVEQRMKTIEAEGCEPA